MSTYMRRWHTSTPLVITFCTCCAVFTECFLAAAPADAQIYKWRDGHGTLVLSDRPRSIEADAVPSPAISRVRTTVPVAAATPAPFDGLIRHHAAQLGVRQELVRAVVQVESGFDPVARSKAGAMGLMQLMPGTARALGVQDPFDPNQNLRGGVAYLRQLLDRYGGDEELALAAYNAGPASVNRFGNQVPPFPETLSYVARVRASTGRRVRTTGKQVSSVLYRGHEIINGRRVPAYTDTPPASGHFKVAWSGR